MSGLEDAIPFGLKMCVGGGRVELKCWNDKGEDSAFDISAKFLAFLS